MKYYEVDFTIEAAHEAVADVCDVLVALAGEAGFESFEEREGGVVGYVQQSLFDAATLDQLLTQMPFDGVIINYKVRVADDQDWNATWEAEGFAPIAIGKHCVVHDGRHITDIGFGAFDISVEIDAQLAFGTGTHATTQMMLSALLELDVRGLRVLDCGCGTGILGIVALKAGAASCLSYDIDEWSTENTRHNAVINCVDDRIDIRQGDAVVLQAIEGTFDVVMANINRNILLGDMAAFCQKMHRGSRLLLSGFYQQDVPLLQKKADGLGLTVCSHKADGEWALLGLLRC